MSITLEEFNKTSEEFIKAVEVQVDYGKKWQEAKYNTLLKNINDSLEKQIQYAISQKIDFNSDELKKHLKEYVDENWDIYFWLIDPSRPFKIKYEQELQNALKSSTTDENYKKHLLTWIPVLKNQIVDAQKNRTETLTKVIEDSKQHMKTNHKDFFNSIARHCSGPYKDMIRYSYVPNKEQLIKEHRDELKIRIKNIAKTLTKQ